MRSECLIEASGNDGLFDETDWGVVTLLGLCLGGAVAVLLLPAVLEQVTFGNVSHGAMLWPVSAMTGAMVFAALQKCSWFPQDRRLVLVASLLLLSITCLADVVLADRHESLLSCVLVAVSIGGLWAGLPNILSGSVVAAQHKRASVVVWGAGIASAFLVVVAGSEMSELLGQPAIWFGISLFLASLGFIVALEIPAMAFDSAAPVKPRSPVWFMRELFWRLLLPALSFRLIAWLYRRLSFEISRAGSPRLATTGFSTVLCSGIRNPTYAAIASAAIAVLMFVAWLRKSASATGTGASEGYFRGWCCRSGGCSR
jgi:hypothetical protein